MSSYEVGGVADLVAAPVAIVAALAVLAPVAGGYAIYQTGKAIHDEMVREYQEALEKQNREQAIARKRLETAQKVRQNILKECSEKVRELECLESSENGALEELICGIINELKNINALEEKTDVISIEIQNQHDLRTIEDMMEKLREAEKLILKNQNDNKRVVFFIESVEKIFDDLRVNEYSYVHDVSITSENQVYLKKLNDRIGKLTEEFYTIVNREIKRYETVPIASVGIKRVAGIFENIKKEIEAIDTDKTELWVLEERIKSIEKNIESYNTYKALLDIEEEKFMTLYLRYKKSCEELGEECKEAVEFETYEELERTVKDRFEALERMKKCSELCEKIGKEAYICMAFEIELNKLNYNATDKKFAENVLHKQLRNCRIGEKLSPFYEYMDDSMMRIFKVNDDVGLQLIIHKDGSSTMETIALKDSSKENVLASQKEHCKKNVKLIEALRKNWFITTDFDEIVDAEHISMEFGQLEGETEDIVIETIDRMNRRREIARKERRRKNKEKANLRSMALHY